jgi:hypothetical protein
MKIVRALIFVAAGCWVCGAVAFAVTHFRQVYPTAENKSVFLKTYTPNTVLDKFKSGTGNYEMASEASDGADTGFATHMVGYEPTMRIKSSDWVALMESMRDDIVSRLTAEHADVEEEACNAADGFKIKYALGKTEGTVSVDPVKTADTFVQPGKGAGSGEVTVRLRIQIREKWFKNQEQGPPRADAKRASL